MESAVKEHSLDLAFALPHITLACSLFRASLVLALSLLHFHFTHLHYTELHNTTIPQSASQTFEMRMKGWFAFCFVFQVDNSKGLHSALYNI